jgi:radical SAM protein with 4Fe4S-binding SPASM domain
LASAYLQKLLGNALIAGLENVLSSGKPLAFNAEVSLGIVQPIVSDVGKFVPPKRINFILTNRCNLRCTYCPEGSHPEDYYADLDDQSFEEIVAFIKEYGVQEASMAYYGELTMVRDWWKKAQRILDLGVALTATTNGHLPLSPDEVATFARFKYIEFSIDSHDEDTVRKVRKKTSVARIVHNFHLIRAYCLLHNLTPPDLIWTGVLTHHVVNQLPGFVAFAASNDINRINFNEVVIYEGAVEKGLNIVDMPSPDFEAAVVSVEKALALAKTQSIQLNIAELPRIRARQEHRDLNAPLVARTTAVASTLNHTEGDSVPAGYTRDCGAPWNELYLDPKGRVYACCNRGDVMGIARTSAQIKSVFSNSKYQELRRSLATGVNLDPACATCAVRPVVPVAMRENTYAKQRYKNMIAHRLRNHPAILQGLRTAARVGRSFLSKIPTTPDLVREKSTPTS